MDDVLVALVERIVQYIIRYCMDLTVMPLFSKLRSGADESATVPPLIPATKSSCTSFIQCSAQLCLVNLHAPLSISTFDPDPNSNLHYCTRV